MRPFEIVRMVFFLVEKQPPSLKSMNHIKAGAQKLKQEMNKEEMRPRRSEKNGIDSATMKAKTVIPAIIETQARIPFLVLMKAWGVPSYILLWMNLPTT